MAAKSGALGIVAARLARQGGLPYAILLAGLTAFFVWWLQPQESERAAPEPPPVPAGVGAPARTVGAAWRWEAFRARRTAAPGQKRDASPAPLFDVETIHRTLQDVALDENGDVVVDRKALAALRAAFAMLDTELNSAQLEELQQIIRTGLPEPAGAQAAKIVGDYYRYQAALREFDAGIAVSDDLTAAAVRYEQLAALRQRYFGHDVAARLFGDEEAYARYVIESMRLEAMPNLSEQEREQWQARLRAALPPGVIPDKPGPDWERRFAAFERERQAVLAAGLSEGDKEAQIDRLLREHFAEGERDAARRQAQAGGG